MKLVFSLIFLMLSTQGFSTQESSPFNSESRPSHEAMEVFLKNINNLNVKNENLEEHVNYPVIKLFSTHILKASEISARCEYRGKSLIEDCTISIQLEENEHHKDVTAIYKFTKIHENIDPVVTVVIDP